MSGAPEDPSVSRVPHDFDAMYVDSTPPPWDIGRPQAEFRRLAEADGLIGPVLDVGCGTGEHALLAAAHGHGAVGVDYAPSAIALARAKAAARGLDVRFAVGDALELEALGGRFETVLDCGLFHTFEDADRPRFEASLAAVVVPGGRYHLLCFSEHQPGDWGPRRVTQDEIRRCFKERWEVMAIDASLIEITIDPAGAQAWHAELLRH